jgi:hypothetical protein
MRKKGLSKAAQALENRNDSGGSGPMFSSFYSQRIPGIAQLGQSRSEILNNTVRNHLGQLLTLNPV